MTLVVVHSGYIYDMETVAEGFICEEGKTEEELYEAYGNLMSVAEEPAGWLAYCFEEFMKLPHVKADVLPPEERD